ncbi:hypothetical protein [Streptomyces sp. NPDC097981]|uniref:hypothetical protein n=1 Tax=Streptomyces sp. NPDC097981 TaxID=3155428 RepID=UPI003317FEBC
MLYISPPLHPAVQLIGGYCAMAIGLWIFVGLAFYLTPGPSCSAYFLPTEAKQISWTRGYTSPSYAGTSNVWSTEGRADGWDIGRVVSEGYERVVWVYKAIDTLGKHSSRLPRLSWARSRRKRSGPGKTSR